MNKASYSQFDRPYRRGLVLGLSLAELFLILLFLLLLASIGIVTVYAEKNVLLEKKIEQLSDGLKLIEEKFENQITEAEIEDLVTSFARNQTLQKEVKKLQDQLSTEKIEKENLSEALKKANVEAQEAEKRAKAAARAIDEIKKKTGTVPACWFVEVPSLEGIRQKHLKLYNVKILDDGFVVRKHQVPYPPNANLGKRNGLPDMSPTSFNRKLSADEFTNEFIKIRNAGEKKLIQDFACRFMVDVYDETSAGNKVGYKKQLRVVEDLFYKFVENSQW